MAEQMPALWTHQLSDLAIGNCGTSDKTPKLSSILRATLR